MSAHFFKGRLTERPHNGQGEYARRRVADLSKGRRWRFFLTSCRGPCTCRSSHAIRADTTSLRRRPVGGGDPGAQPRGCRSRDRPRHRERRQRTVRRLPVGQGHADARRSCSRLAAGTGRTARSSPRGARAGTDRASRPTRSPRSAAPRRLTVDVPVRPGTGPPARHPVARYGCVRAKSDGRSGLQGPSCTHATADHPVSSAPTAGDAAAGNVEWRAAMYPIYRSRGVRPVNRTPTALGLARSGLSSACGSSPSPATRRRRCGRGATGERRTARMKSDRRPGGIRSR